MPTTVVPAMGTRAMGVPAVVVGVTVVVGDAVGAGDAVVVGDELLADLAGAACVKCVSAARAERMMVVFI